MPSAFFDTQGHIYTSLWNKYRPSILKMMIDAGTEPQQYKFYVHEFKALKPTEKSYSFNLQVSGGKADNPTKMPTIARELLMVLQYSKKATELMTGQTYQFKLDRNFLLHVTKVTVPVEPVE